MLRGDENDERRERGAEREKIKKADGRQPLREYSSGSKHRRGIFGVGVWMCVYFFFFLSSNPKSAGWPGKGGI